MTYWDKASQEHPQPQKDGNVSPIDENGWQDIASAPKDKDIILCIVHEEGWTHVAQGRWISAEEDQIDQPGHDAGFVDCEYQCFFPGRSYGPEKHQYGGTQPTHWMPLPKPPSTTNTPE